jgi:hypothetical protein
MNKTTFIILLAILTLSGGIFTISNYQKKLTIEPNTDPQITDVPTSRFFGCHNNKVEFRKQTFECFFVN